MYILIHLKYTCFSKKSSVFPGIHGHHCSSAHGPDAGFVGSHENNGSNLSMVVTNDALGGCVTMPDKWWHGGGEAAARCSARWSRGDGLDESLVFDVEN
jgi:hypothetical protein